MRTLCGEEGGVKGAEKKGEPGCTGPCRLLKDSNMIRGLLTTSLRTDSKGSQGQKWT